MMEGCCAAREDALNHPRESLSSPQRFSGPNDALTCALPVRMRSPRLTKTPSPPNPREPRCAHAPLGPGMTGVEAQSRNFVKRFFFGMAQPSREWERADSAGA